MATKCFCDICGKEIAINDIYTVKSTRSDLTSKVRLNEELCNTCYFDVVNFIKNRQDGYDVHYARHDNANL